MAPLQQLNLKLPPRVVDHWRAQAAAAGLSVRDWLAAVAGPAEPPAADPGHASLADRLAALETGLQQLREVVGGLQQIAAETPAAAPVEPLPVVLTPEPSPAPLSPPAEPVVAAAATILTTAELARLARIHPSNLTRWATSHATGSIWRHPLAGAWRLLPRTGRSWGFERVAGGS